MASNETGFSSKNLLRSVIKYFPILYFGLLALYCSYLFLMGEKSLPPLAIAPFIYSLLIPIVLFLSLPLMFLLAYILFKEQLFIKQIIAMAVIDVVFIFGFFIILSSFRARFQEEYEFLLRLRSLYSFQVSDVIFIFISLMEAPTFSYFSIREGLKEIDFVRSWFGQIAIIGLLEIVLVVGSLLLALPISVFGSLDQNIIENSRVVFAFLIAFYLANVYLRWRMLRTKKLLLFTKKRASKSLIP